jgi:hypothetical protein
VVLLLSRQSCEWQEVVPSAAVTAFRQLCRAAVFEVSAAAASAKGQSFYNEVIVVSVLESVLVMST